MPVDASQTNKTKKTKKVITLDKQTKGANINLVKDENVSAGYDQEEVIFALDIGTRTVVGIVGVQEGEKLKVIAAEVQEHKNRAMLDGQIHDINQVSEIARIVKEKLEAKLGFSLTKVAIAAAGRVLKTCDVKVERDIEQGIEIVQENVSSIEMEAIQKAQLKLDEDVPNEEKTQFYCVGYSVINYYLNGFVISSLLGHKGRKIGVEILATFLPHIVVDSLYTVMNKIGLEVVSLTLEPIAAINVTIPRDLRLLNLALVDIGAGTSDIAITRDGSVVAYGMAPVAGDEITEKIAQGFLVDFNTADKIKIALSSEKESINFVDILGKKHAVKAKDVLELIQPSIQLLADTIAGKIVEFNHKPANAVFLIGGGSQIPGLTELIADCLKISRERVVVRGRDIIQNIKFTGKKLSGPEAITPFGIAVTAQMQKGQDFLTVTVNGRKIRLFNSKKLAVADALILIGFNPGQLIGRTGKSITFEINGVKKIARGEYGKAAEIFVNGTQVSLETELKVGDEIWVNPAEDGKNAEVRVSDFINAPKAKRIVFNGIKMDNDVKVYINGEIADINAQIADGDVVEARSVNTLEDLLKLYEVNSEEFTILVNGIESDLDYVLQSNDIVECARKDIRYQDIIEESSTEENTVAKTENSSVHKVEEKTQPESTYIPYFTAKDLEEGLNLVINGKATFIKSEKKQFIFVDIFNYIDFDLSKPQGSIVLKLNDKQAGFTDMVKSGDVIEIYWDK